MTTRTEQATEKLFSSYWKYREEDFKALLTPISTAQYEWMRSVAFFCFSAGVGCGEDHAIGYRPFWLDAGEETEKFMRELKAMLLD